jgi:protein-tyrosine phosphatase
MKKAKPASTVERATNRDGGIIDLHNHLIPGVDDGAQNPEQAAEAIALFSADGVTEFIATPHVELGRALRGDLESRLTLIDAGWESLTVLANRAGVRAHRGAELRLDTADPDLTDPRLRLAGGRFALVEFPFFVVPPRSSRVLAQLRADGWVPVIAHPERNAGIDAELRVVEEWRDAGAYLQVTGSSLLGRYGPTAQRMAARLLERGLADYLSSDYHARNAPRVAEYVAWLESHGAGAQAERLTRVNPRRLLANELPLPVEGVSVPAVWAGT